MHEWLKIMLASIRLLIDRKADGAETQRRLSALDEEVAALNEEVSEKQAVGDYALKSDIPDVPVQSVNGKTGNVQLSASDVNADSAGTAASQISTHDSNTSAHPAIQELITALTTRLNALADSDDTTLDQLSEIVAYIKSNKSLIEFITTGKVNVSDIVDDLVSTATNKPLSANQGRVLSEALATKQPAGEYAHASDIPEVPESTDPDMYLVTDKDGNRVWEKKLAYVRKEWQTVVEETEVTSATAAPQMGLLIERIKVNEGDAVKIVFAGEEYEGVTQYGENAGVYLSIDEFYIRFAGPGASNFFRNYTGKTGTITISSLSNKYYTLDSKYSSVPSIRGTGYESIILTPSRTASADSEYAVSSNAGKATGICAFAAGVSTANGIYTFAHGVHTIASGNYQHTEGKYNIEDTESKYAHIVGNGASTSARSNAHTLDWEGNGWFAGSVEGTSLILKSSTEGSTKRFRITVDDSGTLSVVEIT